MIPMDEELLVIVIPFNILDYASNILSESISYVIGHRKVLPK